MYLDLYNLGLHRFKCFPTSKRNYACQIQVDSDVRECPDVLMTNLEDISVGSQDLANRNQDDKHAVWHVHKYPKPCLMSNEWTLAPDHTQCFKFTAAQMHNANYRSEIHFKFVILITVLLLNVALVIVTILFHISFHFVHNLCYIISSHFIICSYLLVHVLSRQDASTANRPNKDGPCC